MNTLSLRVKYRPLRIGWCIRDENIEDVRKVLRLTHAFWGGRYNPIIPVNDFAFAKQLVNVFKVDVLYPASDEPFLHNFIKQFTYLPWPFSHKELFVKSFSDTKSIILDVYHPIRRFYETHIKNNPNPEVSAIFDFNKNDPLNDVVLATFGAFPSKEEIGIDYSAYFEKYLNAKRITLETEALLPQEIYEYVTPSTITTYNLIRSRASGWNNAGFYVGKADNFTDIVNFWNLRASAIELLFYDPGKAKRLDPLRDYFLKTLRNWIQNHKGVDDHIAVWTKDDKTDIDISAFGTGILNCTATKTIWNGLNIKPPFVHFEEQSVLGNVSDDYDIPRVIFQLPPKPFYDEIKFHEQHLIVSVNPLINITKSENLTLTTPYIPELNKYYGRECYFVWNAARAEVGGLGIITKVTTDHLSLRAMESRNLIAKIFEVFEMKAEPSQAGLIASGLIQQLGRLQDCRVFKIAGVRMLIEKYNPYQSFTKSAAVQTIGQNNPVTKKPNFSQYEDLFIEQRPFNKKLKPEDVFTYLLKKGVFRVGLKLNCPNCQLDFWLSLDDSKTMVKCEYCGNEFNLTPQLRDRDWAYRRSGLFGREDHQEGAIPVALTLQQLDTLFHGEWMIYTTAMKINPVTASINPCETDLVVLTQGYDGRVQLLIGECKSNKGEITEQDVSNLKKIADTFPQERVEVFIIFSKTAPFTAIEIERCKVAQDHYRYRLILLSGRELEPYFVYERTAKEFELDETAISSEDLAKNTHSIYFDPKPKVVN